MPAPTVRHLLEMLSEADSTSIAITIYKEGTSFKFDLLRGVLLFSLPSTSIHFSLIRGLLLPSSSTSDLEFIDLRAILLFDN
jgi:hypothetical protein